MRDGVAGYAQLGYALPGGELPAVKLLEYLAIAAEYSEAEADADD